MIELEVKGLDEVNRMLAQLPFRVGKKVIRKATFAGAVLLRQAIKDAAPVRGGLTLKKMSKGGYRSSGFLKKNIRAKLKKRQGPHQVIYMVGPMGQAFYGKFVEEGHAAGKRKKYGRGITEATGLRMVPAHPFIMPTFNNMTTQIITKMVDKLNEGVLKEGKALGFITSA